MEKEMVVKITDNILSPLGTTTDANYEAVKSGRTALALHTSDSPAVMPYYASLIPDEMLALDGGYTRFERMCILSVTEALRGCTVDPSSDRLLFIISTTKGNVRLLSGERGEGRVLLGDAARAVATHFGNKVDPVVVSNACISGLCAQIEAMRLIEAGAYDYVVVVGADEQPPFIVSGFQSLKALSAERCRPFDADRKGLNLGEAAATVVYGREGYPVGGKWTIRCGAVRNDANHISGPSRTGEGSFQALRRVLGTVKPDEVGFINAHGTATLYNDEMESIAIERAGLQDVPVGSLKGTYGHTMGAAGILETLVSMRAIEDGTLLATAGFQRLGVSRPLHVLAENGVTDRRTFIKLISGFGGCNAAAAFTMMNTD